MTANLQIGYWIPDKTLDYSQLRDIEQRATIALKPTLDLDHFDRFFQVVTPLSPTDWEIIFNGESITLYPSIGNWNLDCKSHYWIENSKVVWSRKWSDKEINAKRHQYFVEKRRFYKKKKN